MPYPRPEALAMLGTALRSTAPAHEQSRDLDFVYLDFVEHENSKSPHFSINSLTLLVYSVEETTARMMRATIEHTRCTPRRASAIVDGVGSASIS
jgi:hypothetical protein